MPALLHISDMEKRYYYSSGSWGGGGARWAFFAIFIAVIIIVILGTFRANKKRTARGVGPIYGTRWMTPPSYLQSQNQYNQPNGRDGDLPSAYVPTYTARATEYDMGYYDESGNFHSNPNAKSSMPGMSESDNVTAPEQAHQRTTSTSDGAPLSNGAPLNGGITFTDENHAGQRNSEDSLDLYRRPHGAPAPTLEPSARDASPEYGPPPSPPPDMGSSRNSPVANDGPNMSQNYPREK